jgi:predicted phosphodiesterase
MRAAIVSDIHANLTGFRAFLDVFDDLKVERVFCLGDIVGYNPWPNDCVQIIRERSIPCVMGNHDRVASGLEEPDYFNALARHAILWTRRVLTNENREFLSKLPDRLFIDDSTMLVHGSPRDPDEYILMTSTAHENISFMEERFGVSICFFGHSHVTGLFDRSDRSVRTADEEISLEKGNSYLINPGSIGQPRDGDPRSSFLVYDSDKETVRFYRIPYDIDSVYKAIDREGLPLRLGERLFLGA